MATFHSLYLPFDDSAAVADRLRAELTAHGYTLFNPFGLIPGKSYPVAVRLFVAPARNGWVRVVGEADPLLLPGLSTLAPVAMFGLDGANASSSFYRDGAAVPFETLAGPGPTLALDAPLPDQPASSQPQVMAVPIDSLPEDVRSMLGGVDAKQAQNMFSKMANTAMSRSGADQEKAAAAQKILAQANTPPDWNSAGGRQIRAYARTLNLPGGWQTPDFVTVRDAYQVAERLQRRPNASLYPGDSDALDAVPDALSYTPVYAGKNA